MPGRKTIRDHDPDGEFYEQYKAWRAPYICFGSTPATAWNYALIRMPETYDLWEVYLRKEDEVFVQPMWGSRLIEVRVHNRIKKSRLIWVGERTVAPKDVTGVPQP